MISTNVPQKIWDLMAEKYDDWFKTKYGIKIYREEIKKLRQVLGKGGGKVLDVGCGSGLFTIKLVKEKFEVYGLDFSASMVKKAKEKNVEVFVADAHHLPVKNDFFDVVLFFTTFEFLDENLALKEALRVLRKDGYVILGVHNWFNPWNVCRKIKAKIKKKSVYGMVKYYSVLSLKRILKEHLFHITILTSCIFLPFSLKLDFFLEKIGLKIFGAILIVKAKKRE